MKRHVIGYYVQVVMPGADAMDAVHRVEHACPPLDTFNGPPGRAYPLVSDLPQRRGGRQEGEIVKVRILHTSEADE